MKKIFLLLALPSLALCSCSTAQKTAGSNTGTSRPAASLNGQWELDFVPYTTGTFEQLYPDRKPTITFDEKTGAYTAFTGCNTARGKLEKDSTHISFKGDMMMTRMACTGDGEDVFLRNLKRVNQFSVSADGKSLSFIQGDIALMHFHKTGQ